MAQTEAEMRLAAEKGTLGRARYTGAYRTWERKVVWGKEAPVPRVETKDVWAGSETEATTLLNIWMRRNGHALGGLLSVTKTSK